MARLGFVAVLLTLLLAAGAATAVATTSYGGTASTTAASASGSVKMTMHVAKFVKSGKGLVAHGTAIATYTPKSGKPTVAKAPFAARVAVARPAASPSTTCPVLTLELDTLSLDLLGLHVDLSKVVLTITADSTGGVLGKLFCNLSSGQLATATPSTARALSAVTHRSGFTTRGVSFGVPLRQARTLAPGPCSIVDLLLGPLHLELLGLIVDLNQIHLQITADPNGGILGSLLCSIAPPPTTTVVTT
jgi:hypothetical protein